MLILYLQGPKTQRSCYKNKLMWCKNTNDEIQNKKYKIMSCAMQGDSSFLYCPLEGFHPLKIRLQNLPLCAILFVEFTSHEGCKNNYMFYLGNCPQLWKLYFLLYQQRSPPPRRPPHLVVVVVGAAVVVVVVVSSLLGQPRRPPWKQEE